MADTGECCTSGKAAPGELMSLAAFPTSSSFSLAIYISALLTPLDSYLPRGVMARIGSLEAYSSGNRDSPEVLLLLSDGFGLAMHNLMLADNLAQNEWHVVVPDYFQGDPCVLGDALPIGLLADPPTIMLGDHMAPAGEDGKPGTLDFPAWLQKHSHDRVEMLLRKVVADLKSSNAAVGGLLGVGYCFGGKHALRLAKENLDAAAAFHPSFVEPEDCADITVPLYIGLAEKDSMVPPSLPQDLQAWTKRPSGGPVCIEEYPGMDHGFAARPDSQDAMIHEQYDRAYRRVVQFFRKHT
ncbi:hypothetical protein LTR93_011592 [Exophiala xenobiotica]|nr:hypothetical protein LTR93_011592 [Exophiala xenobiotica]